MDLKIFLMFAILFLGCASAHRRHRGKYTMGSRINPGSRRNPYFSRFQSQGRRSKFRKSKGNNLVKLLPYEAKENVKVKERMNVALWKADGQGGLPDQIRPKREVTVTAGEEVTSGRSRFKSSNDPQTTQKFHHTIPRITGSSWPLPKNYKTDPGTVYQLDPRFFYMAIGTFSKSCDTLTRALKRYYTVITGKEPTGQSVVRRTETGHPPVVGYPPSLTHIDISVSDSCSDGFPGSDTNESYSLVINNRSAFIKSSQVWGALRGLETFSQIVYRRRSNSRQLYVNWTEISDYPRFPYRGLMINTGRHYISPDTVRTTLDAMEQNKLNVLHWHLADDQSFPVVIRSYPQLSGEGAFSKDETYSERDIADIVEFARQRGIRVIPELNTPAHTRSWRGGLPDISLDCDDRRGVLDISNNTTYTVLGRVWQDLLSMFPGRSVHLGGEEVSDDCWSRSKHIGSFMEENGIGDYKQLLTHYTKRLTKIIHGLDKTKECIFWDDILDSYPPIDKAVTIQIWRHKPDPLMTSAAESGHRMIYSSSWHLNDVTSNRDWINFYLDDPLHHLADSSQWRLVVGGEACIWGEHVDDSNLLQTMWPRISAVAERLWSAPHERNVSEAEARLQEQRCRMIRRNIPLSPVNDPSWCNLQVP